MQNDGTALNKVEERREEEAAAPAWQPMETVPRDGTPVLVWLPVPMLRSQVHVATYHPRAALIGGVFAFDATSKPTHWMPLPAPPDQPSLP